MYASMVKSKEEKGKGVMEEFSNNTTLHGVSHAVQERYSRRLLWIALLICCVILFIIQVRSKLVDYRSNPVVTNVDLKYPKNGLHYPAVVICNTIQFKVTEVRDNLYELITEIYKTGKPNPNVDFNKHKNNLAKVQGQSSLEFLESVAPKIEDMLLSCTWPNGSKCTSDDFYRIATDFGICYGINTDKTNPLNIKTAGVDFGLHMIFNVGSYQKTSGPLTTVGLKLLIYNQTDLPMVGFRGMDLATGFLTQVGIRKSQREKVPTKDETTCVKEAVLENLDGMVDYSVEKCKMDKEINRTKTKCHCIPFNTPMEAKSRNPETKMCDVAQHFKCVTSISNSDGEEDSCADNCVTVQFRTQMSMSRLSADSLEAMIGAEKNDRMIQHFLEAKETKHRIQPDLINQTQNVVKSMFKMRQRLKDSKFLPVVEEFRGILQNINETVTCFNEVAERHDSLGKLAHRLFETYSGPSMYDPKKEIVPVTLLLRFFLYPNKTDHEIIDALDHLTANSSEALDTLHNELRKVVKALEPTIILSQLFDTRKAYVAELSDTSKAFEIVLGAIERYELEEITKKKWAIETLTLRRNYTRDMNDMIANLKKNVATIRTYYTEIDGGLNRMIATFNDSLNVKLMRHYFATGFGSRDASCVGNLTEYINSLNDTDGFYASLSGKDIAVLCPMVNGDVDSADFLLFTSQCAQWELAKRVEELDKAMASLGAVMPPFDDLVDELANYLISIAIDFFFYQDNILAVNIYYQDLSVEYMIQDYSYGFFSLACDIGGTMGLFLGASMLTIFEIVDFFVIKPVVGRFQKKPTVGVSNENENR